MKVITDIRYTVLHWETVRVGSGIWKSVPVFGLEVKRGVLKDGVITPAGDWEMVAKEVPEYSHEHRAL